MSIPVLPLRDSLHSWGDLEALTCTVARNQHGHLWGMQHSANHRMATWHPINSPVRIQLEEGGWFRRAVRTMVPLLVKPHFRGYKFELEREAIAKAMCLPGCVCQGGRGWGKQIRNVAAGPQLSDSD